MHAANLDPTHLSSASHPLILSIRVMAKKKKVPRILSVCILSIALLLGFFHNLPRSLPRPFPSGVSCVSTDAQFWDIAIRQDFRLHRLGLVPKTSFLSPFPWRLPGVYRQTPGALKVDDGTDSTRHNKGEDGSTRCSQADKV